MEIRQELVETQNGVEYYPAQVFSEQTGIHLPFGKIEIPFPRASKRYTFYIKVEDIPTILDAEGLETEC